MIPAIIGIANFARTLLLLNRVRSGISMTAKGYQWIKGRSQEELQMKSFLSNAARRLDIDLGADPASIISDDEMERSKAYFSMLADKALRSYAESRLIAMVDGLTLKALAAASSGSASIISFMASHYDSGDSVLSEYRTGVKAVLSFSERGQPYPMHVVESAASLNFPLSDAVVIPPPAPTIDNRLLLDVFVTNKGDKNGITAQNGKAVTTTIVEILQDNSLRSTASADLASKRVTDLFEFISTSGNPSDQTIASIILAQALIVETWAASLVSCAANYMVSASNKLLPPPSPKAVIDSIITASTQKSLPKHYPFGSPYHRIQAEKSAAGSGKKSSR